jgi:hypothetical protein
MQYTAVVVTAVRTGEGRRSGDRERIR